MSSQSEHRSAPLSPSTNPYNAPAGPSGLSKSWTARAPRAAWLLLLLFPPAWAAGMVWIASWMTPGIRASTNSLAFLLATLGALTPAVSVALLSCGFLARRFLLQLALLVLELLALVLCWSLALQIFA